MASHTNATGPGPHFLGIALGDQLVTLFIGNKRKKFVVHKSLLHEDFFNKIVAAGASHGNTMHLPEEDPDAFSLFVDWIYRSKVPTSNGNARLHLRNLLGLYVLADKMSLSTLKDKVIDVVQETCSSNHLLDFIVEESFVAKAISILPLESQMYDFISWWLAYHIVSKAIEDHDIFDQEYERVLEIPSEDLQLIWKFKDFNFYQPVTQDLCRAVQEPRAEFHPESALYPFNRDEEDRDSRCRFHCHDLEWDCRQE